LYAPACAEGRCNVFTCDLTSDDPLPENIHDIQFVTVLFMLSAVPPRKMVSMLAKVVERMAPQAILFFRDYGVFDMAHLRLNLPKHKKKMQAEGESAKLPRQKQTSVNLVTRPEQNEEMKSETSYSGNRRFKFSKDQKGIRLSEKAYVRGDGTRTYFFSLQEVKSLLAQAGLCVDTASYHCRTVKNRKRHLSMKRIWVQAKARKLSAPAQPTSWPLQAETR